MKVDDPEEKIPHWLLEDIKMFLRVHFLLQLEDTFCPPNYPSQFRRLAPRMVELGHEVVFSGHVSGMSDPIGLELRPYKCHRSVARNGFIPIYAGLIRLFWRSKLYFVAAQI